MIEYYNKPIPARIREDLADLHEDTLPLDPLPSLRQDNAILAVDENNIPIAYVTWRVTRGRGWIDRIGVVAEHRKDGVASQLLARAVSLILTHVQHIDTYIAAHNVASQRLFLSFGFVPFGTFVEDDNLFIRFSTDHRKRAK